MKVMTGPGGEIRYIVFNSDTQPFGAKAESTGAEVLGAPKHPYTKRLLASLPVPNLAKQVLRREELRMLRARD